MTEQRVALVTGAARGIGNAVAERLASEGCAVAAVSRSREEAAAGNLEKIRRHNMPFAYFQGDISRAEDRERVVEGVISRFGRIDILVNNAGVAPKLRADLLEMTERSMDDVLGVNLKGTFFLTQRVAREMIAQVGRNERYSPRIVNISSLSAYASSTNRGEYCISKAGVSMVTTLFADRLAEYGILVNEIRPGIIMTDMTAPAREKYDRLIAEGLTPIRRWGTPEDIAAAVSLLVSEKLTFSTGEAINVDGGFHIRRL